ncbi:unnamed protein product [Blepharisma stoltei]|uniref:Uncharacterized protein n=1 Tax=Blepharisma stoltei TaxID=1481888 RepID=A0AAU9IZ86_9CILI|nr:unnamed protein product [Blepharisma stoltei]
MYETNRLPLAYTATLKKGALGSLRSTADGIFSRNEILPFLNKKPMSMTDLRKEGILDPQASLENSRVAVKVFHKNSESCDLWKTKLSKINQMMTSSRKDGYPYNMFTPLGPHIEAPNKNRNPKFYRSLSSDGWAFHKEMGEFNYFNITYMKNNSCFPFVQKKPLNRQKQVGVKPARKLEIKKKK